MPCQDACGIARPRLMPVLFRDIEGGAEAEELFAEPRAFRKAYKAAMEAFVGEVRGRCHYAGIDHLMLQTSDDLGAALSFYLHGRHARSGTARAGKLSGSGSGGG